MSERKKAKSIRRAHTNLRLVKNADAERTKRGGKPKEKLRFDRRKRALILGSALLGTVALLAAAYVYIVRNYTVTTIYVEGNVHYTNEEIIDMVMNGRFGDNSLFLAMKYKDKGIEDIPFIQAMDVTVEAKDTIRITVYEKALAGCVAYLDQYVYFDKDGIVVETSAEKTAGIPQVTGLRFDHVILHEPLPVEKPEVFQKVLNITQQLEKYSMKADKIYFDADYQVTLIFGEAKVAMGDDGFIDEKIMKLQYMLPSLEGKKGTLDMREYSEDMKSYSFELE